MPETNQTDIEMPTECPCCDSIFDYGDMVSTNRKITSATRICRKCYSLLSDTPKPEDELDTPF